MQQYERIKAQYPDAVLLFRVGDFYETFGTDAITASRVLGIVLTKRNNGGSDVELAGFPHHSLETYLPRLVRAGHRVAICDQLEDPKFAKTVVQRGVTEVVTPGTSFSDQVVDHRSNNWLAAIIGEKGAYGLALVDVTTGEFLAAEDDAEGVLRVLEGHSPNELLYPRGTKDEIILGQLQRQYSHAVEDWAFNEMTSRERLLRQFGTSTLKGFGIEELVLAQRAAGAVLQYLGDTCHDRLAHVDRIRRASASSFLGLDRCTVRNLELVSPINEGGRTLLHAMDRCTTPMGSRLLKRWLLYPLIDRALIEHRQGRVSQLMEEADLHHQLVAQLDEIGDLERLAGKAAAARISPRELLHLHRSVMAAAQVKELMVRKGGPLARAMEQIDVPTQLAADIARTLVATPPVNLLKGGAIAAGIHAELDELRHVSTHAKELLLAVQEREMSRTGISSLKIGFNNVFGYYLEVRHSHKEKVPAEWVRKQTLVNAERYITEELKDLEDRILGAEERILALEAQIFHDLVALVVARISEVKEVAIAMAELDVLATFAQNASTWNYCRPQFVERRTADLKDLRHPVIEQQLPPGVPYVANDVLLDPDNQQIVMITGPNMSGKSALLRQTALVVIMAQAGSFVPASAARLGMVDRVFTRVGASDNLSTGESTFMVEMNETASILNNLSDRSLVLLDEIGRGTSTYDGISIAWAIAEFLHEHAGRPKTLFATHYHELNEMAALFPRIRNANVAVREVDGKVLFLRKLTPGGSDRSFGIHVAQMAGMPHKVVQRAQKVLAHLEQSHSGDLGAELGSLQVIPPDLKAMGRELQLSIFQLDDPALEKIRSMIDRIDIDTLTPVEALMQLNEIKRSLSPSKKLRTV
jgi:DNA mismatch repair protein MutS